MLNRERDSFWGFFHQIHFAMDAIIAEILQAPNLVCYFCSGKFSRTFAVSKTFKHVLNSHCLKNNFISAQYLCRNLTGIQPSSCPRQMLQVVLPKGLSFQLDEFCLCLYCSGCVKYWPCRVDRIADCVDVSLFLFYTKAAGIVKVLVKARPWRFKEYERVQYLFPFCHVWI